MTRPEFWMSLNQYIRDKEPGQRDKQSWNWANSGFADYARRFGKDPRVFSAELKLLMEQSPVKRRAALDLAGGSQGYAINDLVRWGYVQRGLTADHQASTQITEGIPDHTLKADLTSKEGWEDITLWKKIFSPVGFSLILHRPGDALQRLPKSAYSEFLAIAIDLLAPSGVLVAQLPTPLIPRYASDIPTAEKQLSSCVGTRAKVQSVSIHNLEPNSLAWIQVQKQNA